jgi:hypothetical protein
MTARFGVYGIWVRRCSHASGTWPYHARTVGAVHFLRLALV